MNGCSGCGFVCNCEYKCFACNDSRKYGCSSWRFDPDFPFSDVRNKYVCFSCKRIWKSSVTKYQILNPEPCYKKLKNTHCKKNQNTFNEGKYADYLATYHNKHSKCSKCSCNGLLVGRKFSHCKNDKEWKILHERVKNNEVDLYNDFYDYPRELKKL